MANDTAPEDQFRLSGLLNLLTRLEPSWDLYDYTFVPPAGSQQSKRRQLYREVLTNAAGGSDKPETCIAIGPISDVLGDDSHADYRAFELPNAVAEASAYYAHLPNGTPGLGIAISESPIVVLEPGNAVTLLTEMLQWFVSLTAWQAGISPAKAAALHVACRAAEGSCLSIRSQQGLEATVGGDPLLEALVTSYADSYRYSANSGAEPEH